MKTFVLISCVKSKLDHPALAKDLYISPLFKYNLAYARILRPDGIFILSAYYGLLELENWVEPYEKTLNKMSKQERLAWVNYVLSQLKMKTDIKRDRFVFLAGQRYREGLLPYLRNVVIPFEGLSFGQQLNELKKRVGKL